MYCDRSFLNPHQFCEYSQVLLHCKFTINTVNLRLIADQTVKILVVILVDLFSGYSIDFNLPSQDPFLT